MFCHKCGHKSIDGAVFCQKCGERLIKDQAETQTSAEPVIVSPETATPPTEPRNISTTKPVQQASAASIPTGIQEAYGRLNESAKRCPKIKKIAVSKGAKGTSGLSLTIHGLFYKYIYTPNASSEKTSISWSLTWVLYLVYIPILLCDALFLQFFFQEEYYPALTICCLIGCVIWFPFLFFSHKERKEIIALVNETFDCQISPPSKVPLLVSYVLNLIAIVLCIAAFVFGFGGSADVPAADPNNPVSHAVESVSLSQTYTNDEEGFSFRYPSSWQNLNEDDFEVRKGMMSNGSLILEIYTLDDLGYEEDFYASHMQVINGPVNLSFSGTKDDFQSSLSLTMNEVNVTELLDIDLNGIPARKLSYLFNDNGQTCAVIEYYYLIDDDMYGIRFYALQKNFVKHEPVFKAIMESYTITAAGGSVQSGTTNSFSGIISYGYEGIPIDYLLESVDNVIFQLGDSSLNDEFKLRYGDMEFYLDKGTITSLVSSDPSLLEANGIALNKNRDGLIEIFGKPSEEGGGAGEYFMRFNLPTCFMYFELGEPDSDAWRISISPNATTKAISGEVLYNRQPVVDLLGKKPEELNRIFGAPTVGTPVTGELLYGATEFYVYSGIGFMLDEQGSVLKITIGAEQVEMDGQTLNQNRAGILNLLGTPGHEEQLPEDESGEGFGGYYIMEYTSYEDRTIITVELPDADSIANTVTMSRYDDEP